MSNPRLAKREKRSLADDVRAALSPVWRLLRRDPLSTFLLSASLVLLIVFFSLLGSLGPEGTGNKIALSALSRLAESGQLEKVTLLDYDHQAEAETAAGTQVYADYPASDAATQQTFKTLTRGGAIVEINPQSGKSERIIVVQFLLPILILVCLFSY